MDIGKRIRETREEYGMSAAVLARRTGVAPGYIYQLEHDLRTPSVAMLEKIAKELRTEPAEFLREPALMGKADAPETGQFETEPIYAISYEEPGIISQEDAWAEVLKEARELRTFYEGKFTMRDNGEFIELFVEQGAVEGISARRARANARERGRAQS